MKVLAASLSLLISLVPVSSHAVQKDVQFKLERSDTVVFSHTVHLKKYNNNCKVCHNAIFNLRERRHYTMAEMEKGKSCGACHSGIKAFSVATNSDCVKCHKNTPRTLEWKVKGAGDAIFSHDNHISRNKNCKGCHAKTFAGRKRGITMAQMEKGATCGSCHNGKDAFTVAGNCGSCHKGLKPREITFKIKGLSEAAFSHKFHNELYKCPDCHTKIFPYKAVTGLATMADMEKGKSCGACHNGKTAFTSSGSCDKCHKGVKPGIVKFRTAGGDVAFSHEFHLGMFKCPDCHTKVFPYKAAGGLATMADMEKGKSCGSCHNGNDAFSSSGSCDKCHTK